MYLIKLLLLDGDISGWNVSRVDNMIEMFNYPCPEERYQKFKRK